MITVEKFQHLVAALGQQAQEDIEWGEALTVPDNAVDFAEETIFVICNSGMKNTVARGIFNRCIAALRDGKPVIAVFKHPGKVSAIEYIYAERESLYRGFMDATDKLSFCESLPWIGGVTKYHLAKNFGADVAKPDVHLQRLADREGCTAQQLCERLASATGWRVATVDTLLWRACANGIINSRTGDILQPAAA